MPFRTYALIGKYIINTINRNRERLHNLGDSLSSLSLKMPSHSAGPGKDLKTIDAALGRLSRHLESRNSSNKRQLAVELMNLSIESWCTSTGSTKADLARSSGLWNVYINKHGNERTQTLDRYLDIDMMPKRPRWDQIGKTAEFVLESCGLTPVTVERLETGITKFRSV